METKILGPAPVAQTVLWIRLWLDRLRDDAVCAWHIRADIFHAPLLKKIIYADFTRDASCASLVIV